LSKIQLELSLDNDQAEETITYSKILEYITKDEETNIMWKFRCIISHEGPHKGSQYDLLIEWESGETLAIIATDDPVTCAIYAR
jgi:hypothetical protein